MTLFAFLVAQAVSKAGSRITLIAIPWFVLVTTGSPTKAGVVAFAEMAPFVVAAVLGGPWIDRWGPRRVAIAADAASVLAVAALPLLHRAGALSFAGLLAMVALAGVLRGFGDTAKNALFPRVVTVSGMEITRATTVHDGVNRLAGLLGLPLGGVLIGWLGSAADVLLVDAASFGVCALVVTLFVRVGAGEPALEREPYLRALRGGFEYLRGDRLVLGICLMVLATNLFDQAYSAVYTPVWAHDVIGDPRVLGLVGGAFGLGAVLGNVAYAALAPRLPRYATFAVCFLIGGAPRFAAMAFDAGVWPVLAVGFVSGLAMSTVNPIIGAVSYERIPTALQARVLGLVTAVAFAGIPLGGLLGGLAVTGLGLRGALLVTGAGYLLVTVLPLMLPSWRGIDRRPELGVADRREPEPVGGR